MEDRGRNHFFEKSVAIYKNWYTLCRFWTVGDSLFFTSCNIALWKMRERQDSMKKSISISFHVSESYRRILLYNPEGSTGGFKPTEYSGSPCVALVGGRCRRGLRISWSMRWTLSCGLTAELGGMMGWGPQLARFRYSLASFLAPDSIPSLLEFVWCWYFSPWLASAVPTAGICLLSTQS